MKVYPSWFGMELWGMSNTRVEHANIRVQTMVGWVTQREEGVQRFDPHKQKQPKKQKSTVVLAWGSLI
jgi:hypothetical protein